MRALAPLCAFVFAGASLAPRPALAAKPEVSMLFAGDIDARLHSADRVEGEDGFAVARLRLGARATVGSWFSAVGQAEWAQEKPALLDAYVSVKPTSHWEISLGARKTPLFSSARDDTVFMLPIPERSMLVRAFWPGRDVGLELHRLPSPALPVEAWLRVGNGSGVALGNDNSDFALDARLDAVFGRAVARSDAKKFFGVRIGAGLHLESAEDRLGIRGTTADGFLFYRPTTVSGSRYVAESHTQVLAGPVQIRGELAVAKEGRSKDADGNPATPRVLLDPIRSSGGSVEVAWMITGQHRSPGAWPSNLPGRRFGIGALELGARFERLDLGRGAADVTRGGATSGALSVRWWATSFAAISAAGYYTKYDTPPIEEPLAKDAWLGMVRATFHLPVTDVARPR